MRRNRWIKAMQRKDMQYFGRARVVAYHRVLLCACVFGAGMLLQTCESDPGDSEGTADDPVVLKMSDFPKSGFVEAGKSSYYKVEGLTAWGSYQVEVQNPDGGDVSLSVYADDGFSLVLGSSARSGSVDETVRVTVPGDPGEIYIQVDPQGGDNDRIQVGCVFVSILCIGLQAGFDR